MPSVVNEGPRCREYPEVDFSGADIMTGHACMVASRLGADLSDKPDVKPTSNG